MSSSFNENNSKETYINNNQTTQEKNWNNCFSVKFLEIEDIAKKFNKPCISDIKIGPITYDPEASEEKKRKESTKYPPLKKIGFQLRGLRVRLTLETCIKIS